MRDGEQQGLISAAAFPVRLDVEKSRFEFVQVDERLIRTATFLDPRSLVQGRQSSAIVDALALCAELDRADVRRRPIRWIFHLGHCGSTLLSRVVDGFSGVLGLREPQCLLSLESYRMELDTPLARVSRERWEGLLSTSLRLLGRGFDPEQRVVIKPTSVCGALAERLLGVDDTAVFLHIDLRDYLAALLREPGLRHQAWLNTLPRLSDWQSWTNDALALRLYGLTPARAIALSWEVERRRVDQLQARLNQSVASVDFDDWLADPEAQTSRLASALGLETTQVEVQNALQSAALERYSKDPSQHFDRAARRRELDQSIHQYRDEIDDAMTWHRESLLPVP